MSKSFDVNTKLKVYHIFDIMDNLSNKYVTENIENGSEEEEKDIIELIKDLPNDQINMRNKGGDTLLKWAFEIEMPYIFEYLINNTTIDPNIPDYTGTHILTLALVCYTVNNQTNEKYFQLLLGHPQIDINIYDKYLGSNVFNICLDNDLFDYAAKILKHPKFNINQAFADKKCEDEIFMKFLKGLRDHL